MKKILITLGILTTLSTGLLLYENTQEPVGQAVKSIATSTVPGVEMVFAGERDIQEVRKIGGQDVTVRQQGSEVSVEMPWKDQPGLTFKHDLGVASGQERAKGKRNKEVLVDILDEDRMKIDFLLNEKPKANEFCQTVEGYEDYDFFYQPPLTQEEIDDGAERPENVVGSYAVYHKTLKNHKLGETNYETGKAFHIYRPEVWEVNSTSTREWAELSYTEGELCVTVPQSFLDSAEYPVRVDPTFGTTGQGGTEQNICGSGLVQRVGDVNSAPESATLTNISAWYASDSVPETVDIFLALNEQDSVASDSHGEVGSSIALDASLNTTASVISVSASGALIEATNYIISTSCDDDDITTDDPHTFYDATTNVRYVENFGVDFAASQEDPWTDGQSTNRTYSIYATYTADAGGGEVPQVFVPNSVF